MKQIHWAKAVLRKHGYKVNSVETIIKTPWSSVLKINTDDMIFYLKQTPKDLFLEVSVINLLRKTCNMTCIPEIIAENKKLDCFLMTECGDISLRNYFKGDLQLDTFARGIDAYKILQKATVDYVSEFISLGVPDWRLYRFPALYKELINDADFLEQNGLYFEKRQKLHQYSDKVVKLCDQLAAYNIDECLSHLDFHDNNILYNPKKDSITIIDLGEVAISHPFFSLAACLGNIAKRYNITKEGDTYNYLIHVLFDDWVSISDVELQAVVKIINILLPIYLLFAHIRLVRAVGADSLNSVPGVSDRVYKAFVWFIENIER